MPMNPLPPTAGPAGPAAPTTGTGRKEEPGSADSAFTAMLAALVGAQLPMLQPAQTTESATDAPAGESPAALVPTAAPAPAIPGAAPRVAEALESLLQAQRVTAAPTPAPVPASALTAVVAQAQAPAAQTPAAQTRAAQTPAPQAPTVQAQVAAQAAAVPAPKAIQWLVEPLAPESFTAADASPTEQTALPALADILTRASIRTPAESGQALKAKSEQQQPHQNGDSATPAVAFTVVQAAVGARTDAPEAAKAPAPIPSPIDPDKLMDAIAKSAVSSGDGRYTVTLRLHPEQLGEVHLQLHVAGREVQTTLQVSTPAAQQALQSKGDQLRQSLDQNGLTLSGFLVNTGQGERRRDQELQDQLAGRPRRKTAAAAGSTTAVTRPVRRQTQRTSGFDTLA